MSEFYDQVLEGNQIKELAKVLLEKSGHVVFPYGYAREVCWLHAFRLFKTSPTAMESSMSNGKIIIGGNSGIASVLRSTRTARADKENHSTRSTLAGDFMAHS